MKRITVLMTALVVLGGVMTGSPALAAAPSDGAGGTLVGRVTLSGVPTAGVTVVASQFDEYGDLLVRRSVAASESGDFRLEGLPAGDYEVRYEDLANPALPSTQWWHSSLDDPYGESVFVEAGQTKDVSWNLVKMGGIRGVVTCAACARFDGAISLSAERCSPSTGRCVRVGYSTTPDEQGNFVITSLFPADNYHIYLENEFMLDYAFWIDSDPFSVSAYAYTPVGMILPREIPAIVGHEKNVADNTLVNSLYVDFLDRFPSPAEATGWVRQLDDGTDPGAVAGGFVGSEEYRLIRIDAAYQSILGRAAEPGGRTHWLQNMVAGRITTDDIETSLYSSQEYLAAHGGTTVTFAEALYTNLLHRTASAADAAFWGRLADQNGRAWVVARFWNEPETIGERVAAMYEKYLGRTPDARGRASWVAVALAIGDSGLRAGLTGSGEYAGRSLQRFSQV